mmetsp:Transcript_30971/g.47474  ORF Transcript_30971/g.47474 Transcript_30971/m.47474 type:complete len:579 (+) Transcript_30971:319-2055(+)|eukprot:CAMPEP_0118695706 /NCGR_PEP_ID=MMETSP0800-20121206/13364_1 /TAXON_ID=210618 ORGANISM="Striatella unipunctata, Strain CCMP2910" /NCGR_SAMPLE_ID=MMETSP0800 /ASSEMBLY_ACC=CAM_ASM_000638 /LENGTH=578 /DNA_ID=CAMNT_0006594585 /DNA_START=317 /DNA_END=2053 /DNA_ORIENTATION=-
MAPNADRHAEIWSTRLQRELLALTTQTEATEGEQKQQPLLPPFVKVMKHELVIEKGVCNISFMIDTKEQDEDASNPIIVTLDASLAMTEQGQVDATKMAYPFQKPKAILASGCERFAEGSTVTNGSVIDIDCDWTPSLHLSDAALNVALKIRECLSQGELYYASGTGPDQPFLDPVLEEAVKGAKKLGNFFTNMKAHVPGLSSPGQDAAPDPGPVPEHAPVVKDESSIKVGDVIDLSDSPWSDCAGFYSSKPLRRPKFVVDMMGDSSDSQSEVQGHGAGFSGAAMLRSFAQSAKSVLEESFLMITSKNILELKSNKLNFGIATVSFVVPISMLAKLKFRRQESISLFFKQAPEDPLIYMCADSADAVQQIQAVLKKHGVKGKHTNAQMQRAIQAALFLVGDIKTLEKELQRSPSVDRVDEIMDLYRQAAEKFAQAGDPRHEEVMTHMRKFLKKPLVASILDGSYKSSSDGYQPTIVQVPQGEVLEAHHAQLHDHDDDDEDDEAPPITREETKISDAEFHENMDTLMKEAKEDFENMNVDDHDEEHESKAGTSSTDDTFADLDAMLDAADKEIADIMKL